MDPGADPAGAARLTELLDGWDAGMLAPADLAALAELLREPRHRAALNRRWRDGAVLADALRGAAHGPAARDDLAQRSRADGGDEPARDASQPGAGRGRQEDQPSRSSGSARSASRALDHRARSASAAWRSPQRRRPRGRVGAWTAAALAGIASLVGLALLARGPSGGAAIARIERLDGAGSAEAWVERVDGARERAQAGAALADGDRLRLPADAQARLRTTPRVDAPGSDLALAGDSQLRLSRAGGAERVLLERGALTCDAAEQPPGRPLQVATPQAVVTVVGTRFTVATDERITRVAVMRGAVRVRALADRAGDRERRVSAGESLTVGDAAPAPAAPAGGAAVDAYRPGFAWHRASDWRAGTAPGSTLGNPAPDAAGNPVWRGEALAGGGALDSADPWYRQPGEALTWNDWYGHPGWNRGPRNGPLLTADALMHVLAQPGQAPAVRWSNPLPGAARLRLSGVLHLRWERDATTRGEAGPVEIVLARVGRDGGVVELVLRERLAPDPRVTPTPLPPSAVLVDEQRLPLAPRELTIAAGEALLLTARATGAGWLWLGDDLTLTLLER